VPSPFLIPYLAALLHCRTTISSSCLLAAAAGAFHFPWRCPSGLGHHRAASSCCSFVASSAASTSASAGPSVGSAAELADHLLPCSSTASFAASFASAAASWQFAEGFSLGHRPSVEHQRPSVACHPFLAHPYPAARLAKSSPSIAGRDRLSFEPRAASYEARNRLDWERTLTLQFAAVRGLKPELAAC